MLSPASAAAQITGQWYLPIDAKYASVPTVSQEKTVCTPRWTKAIYFQSQDRSLVDMVWLGDPAAGRFLVVRGYDYTRNADGVLIPTKIEIFPSDAEANLGPRLALLDVSR